MILQALTQHYETLLCKGKVPVYGFAVGKTAVMMTISLTGELLQFTPLVEEVKTGKKTIKVMQSREVPVPNVRSSGVMANFLYDNCEYLLGITAKPSAETDSQETDEETDVPAKSKKSGKKGRTAECHLASQALHQEVLKSCQGPTAKAVLNFFQHWQTDQTHPLIAANMDLLSSGAMIIEVDGLGLAHDDLEVRTAWEDYMKKNASQVSMVCLITGKVAPIARLHNKIKGMRDTNSTGGSLVGFNAPSLESFGREQGFNAPVSEYGNFAYTTALNYLLSDRQYSCQIGDATVVFWVERDNEQAQQALRLCLNPVNTEEDADNLRGLMHSISKGLPIKEVDLKTPCHILGLSPNAARISVRFYLRDTLGSFLQNNNAHYERLDIARAPYERECLTPPMLLNETVNPYSRDKAASPLLSGALMRAILQNTPYPDILYKAVLTRIHAQQDDEDKRIYKITRGKAAIIKAVLLKNLTAQKDREVLVPMLNDESTNKAYTLGRLFSVLEEIQQKANPGINSTIKDRFFTSACATPAMVFPRLILLSSHHLNKIGNEGAVVHLSKLMGHLMNKLEVEQQPYPAQQNMTEQGLFILGYYHQTQTRYTKKEEGKNGNPDQQPV